jgi:hypothetical protein
MSGFWMWLVIIIFYYYLSFNVGIFKFCNAQFYFVCIHILFCDIGLCLYPDGFCDLVMDLWHVNKWMNEKKKYTGLQLK